MLEKEIDLTVFVACYNEAQNIVETLDTVVAACTEVGCTYEIVIIDDASRDDSVAIIEKYRADHPEAPIILKVNEQNEGLGNNFTEAAFIGHGTWYRLVCGDNVEPKETLVKIFSHIGKAELLIPYTDKAIRTPFRRLVSHTFTGLVNLISGHNLHYYNGLPLTRRYYVMRWHSNAHGFGFQADLVTRLLDRGLSYLEIPVQGQERTAGSSAALTFKNFCSVAHSLLTLLIRRVSKVLYGRS
jgi:glycosyltransferase involved in cell wall biosynthesis